MIRKTVRRTLILALVLIPFIKAFGQEKDVNNELWEKAIKIHKDAVICDAHAHQLVFNKDDKVKYHPNSKQLEFEMVKKGKIDAIGLYFAYYPLKEETLVARVKSDLKAFHERIDAHTDKYTIISETSDIEKGINNNDLMIIPGVEYFYGALNGRISTIDSLYNLGIRAMMLMDNEYERLSYNNDNANGDSNLNVLAQHSIEIMNDLGMLIDITHLDDQMQEKVIDHSDHPVIASHSSVRAVHNIERNIPDYIIKKLVKKGGSIMITFNSGDLAGLKEGRCKIEPLIDHIEHAVKIAGIDHVGIGSDFNGAGLRSPKGLEDASGFPLITYHLLKRGYAEDDIKKIMGENYLRLLSEVINIE
jgi:membrane dipeptidase